MAEVAGRGPLKTLATGVFLTIRPNLFSNGTDILFSPFQLCILSWVKKIFYQPLKFYRVSSLRTTSSTPIQSCFRSLEDKNIVT